MTRQALTYAELTLRTCGLVYGEGACQAALGVTGEHKCFNTRATCQDRVNFDLAEEPGGVAEYVSSVLDAAPSGATVNFTGVAIEAGGSVALTVSVRRAGGNTTITSATINDEPAEIIVQNGSGGSRSAVLFAEGPFGDELDISITTVDGFTPDWVSAAIWRVESGRPVADTATSDATSPSPTETIDAPKDGSVLAAVTSYLQSATTWTGLDEVDDFGVSSGHYSFAGRGFAAEDLAHGVTATQTYLARTAPTLHATFPGPRFDTAVRVSFTGLASGDMLLVAIARAASTSGTTPSGWTLLDTVEGNGARIDLYRRNALWTSGSTLTQDFVGNLRDYGVGMVIKGVTNTAFIRQIGKSTGSTTTSPTAPAITTDIANTLVIDLISRLTDTSGAQFSAQANANLTSYGENFDNGHTEGSGGGISVASGLKAAAGGTGTSSATLASTSAYAAMKLGIAPTDNADASAVMAVAAFEWTRPIRETRATMRFAKAADYRPQDIEAIASIADVSVTPARIKPGEDLGSRATMRVSFKEHPHPDTGPGLDPYFAERAYDPYRQGTFWSKFRARQPYLKGEELVLRQGFVGQSLGEMETSKFIVESFDGPTVDGIYTLIAHDPLKMLDGDRAQCPRVNRGRLSVDITDSETSFTIIPTGLGDAEYAASGWLNLGGKEMVSFTRSGDTFTIVRAQMNTVAVAHTAGDRVQQAARFDSMDPADIIHALMTDYAGVPEEWIPLGDWLAETGGYLQRVFDTTVAEPTAVAKLVAELMEQAGLSIWWDPEGEQIRLRVLRPIPTDVATHDETLMKRGSLSIREQPDKRYSEVWIHFGQVSPLGGEDVDNYPLVSVTADLEAQDNYQSAKIKKIYSRWIGRGGRTAADRVGSMVLSRYRDPPRLFTYSLQRGAQGDPILGEGYQVSHRSLQDATGERLAEPVQIVSLGRGPAEFAVTAEGFSYNLGADIGDRQVTIVANTFAANFRTLHDDLYPEPRPGDTVTCVIEAQVIVGGAAGLPAFDVGSWPTQAATGNRTSGSPVISGLSIDATALLAEGILVSGTGIPAGTRVLSVDNAGQVTLTANASSGAGTSTALTFYTVNLVIENRGTIAGIGGKGGKGRSANGGDPSPSERNGVDGGTGLYSRYPFTYRDAGATTLGGGGGGAGGSCANLDNHRGGGGGGGAGAPGGAAGIGPGGAEDGEPGTLTTGGAYGRSYTSSTFWSSPSLKDGIHGGAGGDPGTAGDNDVGGYDLSGGSPGAAGPAIDGLSYLTQDGATGTRLGSQIN